MNEAESIDRVIAALKKVPEKDLLIIELVNKVCLANGQLDYDELARIQPDVNLAVSEAKMYGAHTLVAVDTLKMLQARTEDA
ncbi:hypothetical protein ES707_19875 [subsurface metagenome]